MVWFGLIWFGLVPIVCTPFIALVGRWLRKWQLYNEMLPSNVPRLLQALNTFTFRCLNITRGRIESWEEIRAAAREWNSSPKLIWSYDVISFFFGQ